MKFFSLTRIPLATCVAMALVSPSTAAAQTPPEDEAEETGEAPPENEPIVVEGKRLRQQSFDVPSAAIVVTASRIRQGGAQDIKHFRSVSLDGNFLPPISSLTMEGLLGEHDLALPSTGTCAQLFCISAHAMEASLPGREQDRYFVGLGFESGIDADLYRAQPVSLVAVVDRSGSMNGAPLERVKEGLRSALAQLRVGDRMGIVIYGSETVVHFPVTDVAGNEQAIEAAIGSIASNGSTAMEAGLKLGYATAFDELPHSRGKTRLMLFTDENPNVGNTSPEGFMGQAIAGSRKGVGLTTIGVGVHFDGALATKISSVRGGNLFFLDREGDADELFGKEFYNMVSEVAHDVAITIDPADGFKVTGIFGVPDNMMTQADDGLVTVTISSAFLSSNGGGIYFSLGKDGASQFLPARDLGDVAPAEIAISYVDALSGELLADKARVRSVAKDPPERLVAAQLLVDQYFAMSSALDAYHSGGDRKAVFHTLDGLSKRMASADVKGFEEERELVDGLRGRAAYLAGYAGELPRELKPLAVVGMWRVVRHRGVDDVARGDRVEFTQDQELVTYRTAAKGEDGEIWQTFRINEKQIHIDGTELTMSYWLDGDRLRLRDRADGTELVLERVQTAEI